MGVETEYAVSAITDGFYERCRYADRLVERAYEQLVTLHDLGGGGLFLENGSRLYVDSGNHPELCTPECTNPTEVVRYLLAGEQIMLQLAKGSGQPAYQVFKHNQDYLSHQGWGCHESYLHRANPNIISSDILAHLVTRIIFTGAGGFDVFRRGPEFLISPRTSFLKRLMTENSTGTRGILHIKDEPHAQYGYHRFHLLCGESLSSELATWLKMATTMLVVAMSDVGLHPGSDLRLSEPLLAVGLIAEDPTLEARLQLVNGKLLTALEIQRCYLAKARDHQRDDFMPPWAEVACDRWEETLNLIEDGPEAVATKLDWAIKQKVFKQHARRRGFTADRLDHWKVCLREVQAALTIGGEPPLPSATTMLDPFSPVGRIVERTLRKLCGRGFDRDELEDVFSLVDELREIDVRFGELGADGLFCQLDRAGVLTHRMDGVSDIETAMTEPPSAGRARVRGLAIRECFEQRGRYRCDWQGIVDHDKQRILDLSDPFVTNANWRDAPVKGEDYATTFADLIYFRNGPRMFNSAAATINAASISEAPSFFPQAEVRERHD